MIRNESSVLSLVYLIDEIVGLILYQNTPAVFTSIVAAHTGIAETNARICWSR